MLKLLCLVYTKIKRSGMLLSNFNVLILQKPDLRGFSDVVTPIADVSWLFLVSLERNIALFFYIVYCIVKNCF